MKYNTEILIKLPREEAVKLFLNPDLLKKWQPGLIRRTHLDGTPGEEGAIAELVYEGRKGELLMKETITSKKLPELIQMSYHSRGVYNEVKNHFSEPEPGVTRWQIENYFRFRGMMMLMIPFMKQAFIQNTILNMDRFKIFAEFGEVK
jgi:hypothetical protein